MSDYIRSPALKALDKSIIAAAREGDCASVTHMVNFLGVPVDFQEWPGSATALMTAAQKGYLDILKFLLMNGADPNIQDREHKTALIVAVMNNQIACIKPLMKHGANPNLYSKNGWTALYIAANRGFTSIVKELVSAYGVSNTKVVHKLEIDMSIQNTVGGNVLMVACMQGHLEIVELLTYWGADVNGKDNNWWTALMKAADKGHAAVVAHLVKSGADVTATDKSGFTALHLAAKANMIKAAEVLLSSNAAFEIINVQDTTLRTALFYAAQNGHVDMVKLLMKHGADPSLADKAQRTASTVAKDPTGQIQNELKNIVIFPTSGEKHPDAVKDACAPSLTEEMKNLNVHAANIILTNHIAAASTMENNKLLSQKRQREYTTVPEKLRRLDADFIAALWCGDVPAAERLQAAAEQGDAFAQGYLAVLYHSGCRAIRSDRSLASKYASSAVATLENAEEDSKPTAMFLLGVFSYEAIGVAEDLNRALRLLKEAAGAGHTNAQYMVGLYYEQSEESQENNQLALHFFLLAAKGNHPQATFAVGYFYARVTCGVVRDLVEGFKYFLKAAELGHACAATNVGTCFQFGNGVDKNEEKAVKYFQLGAERGDPYGIYNVAVCCEEGIGGTEMSIETAAKFYHQAAELGHAKAQVEIAMHYLNNTGGVSPSDVMAAKYFKLAADQGDVDGLYRMGQCFMHGRGVNKDTNTAVNYLERATAQEHACARIDLAFCLVCRRGTEEAVTKARSMLGAIISSLDWIAKSVGLPPLVVIVPRWRTVDVSGYAMQEASSDYRLYFLDHTTLKPIDDQYYDITASRQWLMDAAPVLKAGLLCLYLSGNGHLLPSVDLAMNVLQELPRDVYTPSHEVCCAGDSEAILRLAYQVIYEIPKESKMNNSEPMSSEA